MGCTDETPKAACTHTAASLPYYFGGEMYTSQVAARAAAFLHSAGIQCAYRKHRLVLGSPPHAELMDFWLPACNTFLFVYPDMPLVAQCRTHEAVARLGHHVTVLVGAVASPVRVLPADPVNGWRGWTLEPFTADLQSGWTSWVEEGGRVQLAGLACPYDERCCTERMKQLYRYAEEGVSQKPDEEPSHLVESLRRTVGKMTVNSP